jgi:hypothetical protein
MVSDTFICKNAVTCVFEQCTYLGDWLKFFCSITVEFMLEECSFYVTASRIVSSYSLMFLSSLWLSVNKTGHDKTFQISQGNFTTDAGEWVCHCVLNAC